MVVNEIESQRPYLPIVQQRIQDTGINTGSSEKFVDAINELVTDTNTLQKDSTDLTERMIKGEPVDLHDVMIASQKAKTSFQLLLEIRNRFLDLYKEVSRMQV